MVGQTYETTRDIAEAVKSANNLIQFYQDKLIEHNRSPESLSATHLSTLSSYTGKTNSHLSSLLNIKNSIQDDGKDIVNADNDLKEIEQNHPIEISTAEQNIKEKEGSLAKLKAGPDKLDIRAKQIAIQQKEDALLSAQQNLADYYIRAPFDGVIAEVSIKKGDIASSATVIATLITKQKIAEISLNEVDAAKIKEGQKATLTFDAVSELSITGEVAEIDTLGTVSQGVVTYKVKIVFDTQDERVKPGMSVSASIITEVKQDVLLVPNSAVKILSESNYVEIPNETVEPNSSNGGVILQNPLLQQIVQIGLSNDTSTEIISGLKEGDQVVVRTISSSASQNSNNNKNGNQDNSFRMMIPR